jgi:NSS family neurotransmitter:Na+ symporter
MAEGRPIDSTPDPTDPNREQWGSRRGFLLAAAGSAVGLGNLWGFPYKASSHGGAAFVVVYLLMIVLVCLPLLIAELSIGRRTGESPVMALFLLGGRRWRWVGYVLVLNSMMILAFYSVVSGWTLLSLGQNVIGGVPADPASFFGRISQGPEALLGHLLAMALTGMVIFGGIRRGIERLSVSVMPLLYLLLIALAVWASQLSGAGAGYRFYLQPDFRELLSWSTITAATGHAFFSLSVGLGAMITYASYLRGRDNLVRLGSVVAAADTTVALLGGLVTFPLVAHFQLLDGLSDSTIGALFVAIPSGMNSLGGGGRLVAVVFFLVLAIAALTSAVSLLEVSTAGLIDRLGWSRRRATWLAVLVITLLGIPPAIDNRWIDVAYSLFGEAGLIFGGLMTAILLGWSYPSLGEAELAEGFPHPRAIRWWVLLLRWLVTPMLALLLVQSLRQLPAVLQPFFSHSP